MMKSSLIMALALVLTAGVARADEPDAKELYKRGTAHFSLGRFAEAAAEYEAAFEKHPDPVILYNIAQSYRLSGNKIKALFFYRSYLRGNAKAGNRAEVEERIATLEQLVAQEKNSLDKPPNNTAPLNDENDKEKAQVPSEDKQATTTVTTHTAPADESKPTPVYKKWWLWTIVGVVVVAGVGIGLGVGLSQPGHFSANLPSGGPSALTIRY